MSVFQNPRCNLSLIRVVIVEDNVEIRKNICQLFTMSDGYECAGQFGSFEDFFDSLTDNVNFDVLIADIGLPGMSGIEGMKKLRQDFGDIDIIMFTVYNDSDKIFDSLLAGASGYLLKSTPLSEIKQSVDVIASGGSVMSPSIARKVIDHFGQPKKIDKEYQLTPRENEVVQGLVDGLSYKMIADRLDISIDTVRSYIKSIYKKLYVNSRSEVIKKAFEGRI